MMSLRGCHTNFPAVAVILYALKYCTMPHTYIPLCVYLNKELTGLLVFYIHADHKTVLFSNTILHATYGNSWFLCYIRVERLNPPPHTHTTTTLVK